MFVYVVRHAHAVTEEENPSRPLSERGRIECQRLASFFRANKRFAPVQLWHSPLERSHETAVLLARNLELDVPLVEIPGLLPEDDPHEVAERLAALSGVEGLAVVGHEPHLSALATLLVRDKERPAIFEFKKGAVLALERTNSPHKKSGQPRWRVCWHISPALLP
jgi:phosphohistidine phosphatase